MRGLRGRVWALAVFVALLWAIQMINWITGYGLNFTFGLIPRRIDGLDGVVAMPLLHGSFSHLVANTLPLLVMGALLVMNTTRALWAVNAVVVGLGGGLVWLLGNPGVHVGASGLVFGWFGFLVARGFVDRSAVTVAVAFAIAALYGSILWGVLPGQPGVSWEAHLFGMIAGIAAALLIRSRVGTSRKPGGFRS